MTYPESHCRCFFLQYCVLLFFQINDYLPGMREKAIVIGDEIYHRAGAGLVWAREHGLDCIELAAESAFKAAFAGAELIKDGAFAVVRSFKDIVT